MNKAQKILLSISAVVGTAALLCPPVTLFALPVVGAVSLAQALGVAGSFFTGWAIRVPGHADAKALAETALDAAVATATTKTAGGARPQ